MACLVSIPDDLFEQSMVALKVKPAWDAFLAALKEAKVDYSAKIDVLVLDGPRKRTGKMAPTKPVVLPVADEQETQNVPWAPNANSQ